VAEAEGRMNQLPGIAMVTRGPAAANAHVGLHTAWQDSGASHPRNAEAPVQAMFPNWRGWIAPPRADPPNSDSDTFLAPTANAGPGLPIVGIPGQ
jgi:hypothetical protein